MNTLALAWRQLRRDLAAGEVRILLAALVLAVVAVTSVGLVTDRAERALAIQANRLLGGDVVVRSDAPIEGAIAQAAKAPGLRSTGTIELNTMLRVGQGEDAQLRLGELRALGQGFPLRGSFTVIDAKTPAEHPASGIPAAGTLWMTRAGADTLGARLGEIAGAVQNVTDTLAHIAAAVEEQATTADEVSGNIQQVDQAAGRLLDGARAVNQAADTLSKGSRALSDNTARFRLS